MRGLAQYRLGELLGVGAVRAAGIESGEHQPNLSGAFKVAAALDCTLMLLLVPNELTGLGEGAAKVPLRGLTPGPRKRPRPSVDKEEEL
jgi:transcriptional regulator with XRE-family HTH domain